MNGLYKYLDVSTAHIAEATSKYIARQIIDDRGALSGTDDEYGFWLYVSAPDDETPLPDDLQAIFKHARRLDASWVRLDRDGFEHDHLPKFDW